MRIVFMGTPEFAARPLTHLILNHYEVVAVYTQSDKPAGRGRSLAFSPVKRLALERGLTVVQPVSFKKPEAVAQLTAFRPDAIVVAAYGKILPQSVLDIPRFGCINIHGSLLPKFRGAAPIPAAIIAGDEFTGVSIMKMDTGMDTGPVFTRAQIPVSTKDTTGSLTSKLSLVGAHMLLDVLASWFRNEITPRAQDSDEATYCSPVAKDAGRIDWRLTALDIWQRVRAFQPWPGAYTTWQGKRLEITEAIPLSRDCSLEAGRVVTAPEAGKVKVPFGVCTGSGVLGVLAVQLEGKRVMSAGEFLRGQRQFNNALLSS